MLAALGAIFSSNPFYDAAAYKHSVATVPNGLLERVAAPNSVPINVVHLFGTPRERGLAHGQLLSAPLLHFVNVQLPTFYEQEVEGLDLSKLPTWLQAAIRQLGAKHATKVFELALQWLGGVQFEYNAASAAAVYEEIDAIAEGACGVGACNATELAATLRQVNVLSDLIRMQCSMLGAWGGATPDGHLLQLRSLDFGGGPFANATVLLVHHLATSATDDDGAPPSEPFAALSWPGFAGVITGFNPRLSLSEKVNDVHGGGTPPGTYRTPTRGSSPGTRSRAGSSTHCTLFGPDVGADGQTTALVMRDALQFSRGSKEEAVRLMQAAHRT